MLLIIPGLILAIIGDYCMGLEPADSTEISGMISSGWLAIADWRIAVSNIGGMIGTALYTVAAFAFLRYLQYKLSQCNRQWDRAFLKTYMVGLIWGVMVFMYFHLACGTLIHNFNVIYDAAGGNTALAVEMWNRTYSVQFVTYWVSFIVLGITTTGGWIAVVLEASCRSKKHGFWQLRWSSRASGSCWSGCCRFPLMACLRALRALAGSSCSWAGGKQSGTRF